MAEVHYRLGTLHLDLKEFEKAQNHLQISFETSKEVANDTLQMQAYAGAANAARLAGNLHDAKKILEKMQESMLGT